MRLHRYAVAAALATFVLLIFGGLVSTTESGLACPDWPLCEGKFIPKMIDGKEFEHSHRLVASFVGAMTFGLTALLVKHRRRDKFLVRLGALAAIGVTIQALLGALTVKLKLPWWVSSSHLAVAMAFFTLIISLAFLTRQRLVPVQPDGSGGCGCSPMEGSAKPIVAVILLTYAQIVVGGFMRHLRGGLACGMEFPTCLGTWWPLDGHTGVHLHMVHRVLGVIAGIAVVWLAVWIWPRAGKWTRVIASAASGLVLLQVGLGILTVLWSRELVTMTVHSSVAALLLASLVSLYWMARPLPWVLSASSDEQRTEGHGGAALEVA
jgi:heme A synthase